MNALFEDNIYTYGRIFVKVGFTAGVSVTTPCNHQNRLKQI